MKKLSINESRHFNNSSYLKEFIKVIYAYVISIQNLRSATPQVDPQPLKGALNYALRLYTGTHATFVSESVLINIELEIAKAKKNKVLKNIELKKLCVNPFDLKHEQRNMMGKMDWYFKNGNSREMSFAVWEHADTIKDMTNLLITLDTEDAIEKVLKKSPGVAWISRAENKKLNNKGYGQTRPGGALKCYKEVGITLFNEDMYKDSSYFKK